MFSEGAYLKKINIDEKTIKIRKVRIKSPLDGSFANVWTEFKIPDLTRKVPTTLMVKVKILKIITHEYNPILLSRTKIEWSKAVIKNHGIKEEFSTGSQNQYPPQPNS